MTEPVNIVWFKRDLRIADHRPLALAAEAGPVLPLYIVEPALWQQQDASARQWEFAAECLSELQEDLAAVGQPLWVMVGDAVAILQNLHKRFGIAALFSHAETGNGWTYARDRAVAAWCRSAGVAWREERQFGVIRRIKSRDGWAQAWDRDMEKPIVHPPMALAPIAAPGPMHIPTSAELGLPPDLCPHRQSGGRRAALDTLASFLETRGRDYRFEMSSPVTAFDASSRLSPHLAWGTIAMREVAQDTRKRSAGLAAADGPDVQRWRASMRSFAARQYWHCHFMQKLEDEPGLEFENLHRAYDGVRPDIADPRRLAAWCGGNTGFPFVDACMRALDRHGWLNFRMRAMLMSFASYHLWLPWRETGLHLARKFVDYEPGIHWPQVQMQSGTTGINTMRIYNPIKQGFDQDPTGTFVRTYVPELSGVPDMFVHEPWRWEDAAKLRYPPPIVDNAAASRAAREALYGLRRSPSHKEAARRIVDKHGSRKSGIAQPPRKPKTAKNSAPNPQFALDV
ncbi:MAG: deoxyribodipyrimidine photo-lyase [Telmatospirillum sp.]|nr:deoxyribodipyrimidine photo-lyase [Telmatospirillum sp.]